MNIALILASGTGERSGLNQPKQFFLVGNKTLLEHTIETFNNHPLIDEIIVVTHKDHLTKTQNLCSRYEKITKITTGGKTRQESSYNGVLAIQAVKNANILIHDAVRAFVSPQIITTSIQSLEKHDAVCCATETTDTILEIDESGYITKVPCRKNLRCAQTPQCFKLNLIKKAHELAIKNKQIVTDDCGLILANNLAKIFVIPGEEQNKKITYPQDLEFANWIYEKNT